MTRASRSKLLLLAGALVAMLVVGVGTGTSKTTAPKRGGDMTMIIVSHDLGVVAGRTDEVAVMYSGRIVEQAATRTLFREYRHRYTEALLQAIPRVGHEAHARLTTIPGQPPSLLNRPPGCQFAPRCGFATDVCRSVMPALSTDTVGAHTYRCHVPVERGEAA